MLVESSNMLAKSLARLSSGSQINSPEDDPAGMAVSMKFDAQISRTNAAKANVGNAISYSQTQDGFLQKIGKALNRMSELTVLAQDVTKTTADKTLYQSEFATLQAYISSTAKKDFNGVSLFTGTSLSVTTDPEGADPFSMTSASMASGNIFNALQSSVTVGSTTALSAVKSALDELASNRSTVGANISRLTYTSDQLSVVRDNLAAANSRIKDVDVAEESTQFARFNILVQAGTAMLAQANAVSNTALRLLQ